MPYSLLVALYFDLGIKSSLFERCRLVQLLAIFEPISFFIIV